MKAFARIVSAGVLISAFALSLAADHTKSDLQKQYNALGAAYRHDDVAVFEAVLAPDFTLKTPDGKTWDRARTLSDFKTQMARMKNVRWSRKVTDVKQIDQHYDVVVTGHFSGWFAMGKDPKQHHFELESLTVDSWRKGDQGWQLIHSDVQKLNPKIDGKEPKM